jgi:hypothetical protein
MRRCVFNLTFALTMATLIAWPAGAQEFSTNITFAKRQAPGTFVPAGTNNTYQVTGVITSPNFVTRTGGRTNIEFYIQDAAQDPTDNAGVMVYIDDPVFNDPADIPCNFAIGAEISMDFCFIDQRNGTRYLAPDLGTLDISQVNCTPSPITPYTSTLADLLAAAEDFEGSLVRVEDVGIASGSWPGLGTSSSLTITDGTGSVTMRIDADTDVDGQLPPTGSFDLESIFTQFDTSATPSNGYQILVRFYADIDQGLGQVPPELVVNPSGPISAGVGETARIQLLGQDRNGTDTLTFANPGSPGLTTDLGNREAEWTWTPGPASEDTTNTITLTVSDGAASATQQVEVIVLPATLAKIDLNEVLYDPSSGLGGKAGDANNDGVRDSRDDEFVEIINANLSGTVDIGGWNLIGTSSTTTNDLYTFPPGTLLPAQTAVVVFGGGSPSGAFGNAIVLVSTNTGWALSNSGLTLRLFTDTGIQVFAENYADMPGYDSDLNQALTRNADIVGDFGPHTPDAHPFLLWSPGTGVDGAYFDGTGVANSPPVMNFVTNRTALPGQTVVMTVEATDPDFDTISLGVNPGAPGSFVDNGGGRGTLTYTYNIADTGTVFSLTFSASDTGGNVSTALAELTVPDAVFAGVIINEFLPDPSGPSGNIDSNKDGVEDDFEDEFVEIVNTSASDLEIGGFQVADSSSTRHVFEPTTVPAGGAIVVFGGGSLANFFDSPAQTASSGTLGLNNGGDTITLYDADTNILDQVIYAEPVPDGASLNRDPDGTGGDFKIHTLAGSGPASAGLRSDQSTWLTDQPPIQAPIPDQSGKVDNLLTFDVFASDVDGHAITMFATDLPAWATYPTITVPGGTATNTFSGTPTATETAVVTFCSADINGTNCQAVTILVETTRTNYWDFETGLQDWVVTNRASNRNWDRIGSGGYEGSACLSINGFTADVPNDDWLIGPPMDLTPYTQPEMTYWRWFNYDGEPTNLTVWVATNFPAGSDPADHFTFVEVVDHDFTHDTEDETWLENLLALGDYAGSDSLRVAFRYVTGEPFNDMHAWRVDEIRLREKPVNAAPEIDPDLPTSRSVTVGSTLSFVVSATEPDGDLITLSASNLPANASFPTTNAPGSVSQTFTFTPDAGQIGAASVLFDATDVDGSDQATVEVRVLPIAPCGLIISEYIEGTSNNKAIELYNGTDSEIDLAAGQYALDRYNNGTTNLTGTTLLTGTIASGDTYLIVNNATPISPVLTNSADQFGQMFFNGDDALVLREGGSEVGTVVDSFGRVGEDPGSYWGTPPVTSRDTTLIRKSAVRGGDKNPFDAFDPADEYDALPVDDFSNIKIHDADDCPPTGDADTDGDGIPDWWELLYFGGITNAVATNDEEPDGPDNYSEYVALTDPTNAASFFAITDVTVIEGTNVVVTFSSSSLRNYQPQYTEDIVNPGAWSNLGAAFQGAGVTNDTFTDTADGLREYRIEVSVP